MRAELRPARHRSRHASVLLPVEQLAGGESEPKLSRPRGQSLAQILLVGPDLVDEPARVPSRDSIPDERGADVPPQVLGEGMGEKHIPPIHPDLVPRDPVDRTDRERVRIEHPLRKAVADDLPSGLSAQSLDVGELVPPLGRNRIPMLEHACDRTGRVPVVGVHHRAELPARPLEAAVHRRVLALVALPDVADWKRSVATPSVHQLLRLVGRPVVDYHPFQVGGILLQQAAPEPGEGPGSLEGRGDDADPPGRIRDISLFLQARQRTREISGIRVPAAAPIYPSSMPPPPRRPLRLLFVIYNFYVYGGAENQLEHLAGGLAGMGYDVTVCCIEESERDTAPLEALGVRFHELGASSRLQRIAAIPALTRLARAADVVQCTMWDASLWGRIGAILARRPVIVADHTPVRSVEVSAQGKSRQSVIALHNRLLDPFTLATVACSTSQDPMLIGEGVAAEKIVHIPNGVPVAAIRANVDRGLTREEVGLPPTGQVVMHVGAFRPQKNHMGSLDAMERLHRRVGGLQLVFVGDGETRPEVESRARELNGDWIHFLGARYDIPELLALADVMILPSHSEAMPMVILEAMAVGVPVVANDVGDVRLMLGGGGICVPPGDSQAFAEACEQVLSDDDLRHELRRLGREQVRRYDSDVMVERYSELFEEAISPPRA